MIENQISLGIKILKEIFEERVLEKAPLYKQMNIALGLVSGEEKNKIIGIIRAFQMEYEARKGLIEKAETFNEIVDAIYKDLV